MRSYSRRRFLKAAVAAAALPRSVWASKPSRPDVVVIGAGAAGLAAARTLMDHGVPTVVVEARNRIGGRAWTDTDTFGVPYDIGCHWLHDASDNPWVGYGRQNGFNVYADEGEELVRVGDRWASAVEMQEFELAAEKLFDTLSKAHDDGLDVAASDLVDPDDPWFGAAASLVVQNIGKELDELSTLNFDGFEENDYLCNEGFGALVAHYGRGIPVELSTVVESINWGGRNVQVKTSAGTIDTGAVIVTAPIGVLAAGDITFVPRLPRDKYEALEYLPMGSHNNITLQFDGGLPDVEPGSYAYFKSETPRSPGFAFNTAGSDLSLLWVGGDLSRDLEHAGVEAAVDFGLQEMCKLLGADISSQFVKGSFTQWSFYPWSRGSYASGKPGMAGMRDKLREPVAGRILFAGEACSRNYWATCGGAHLSGLETAEAVIRSLQK